MNTAYSTAVLGMYGRISDIRISVYQKSENQRSVSERKRDRERLNYFCYIIIHSVAARSFEEESNTFPNRGGWSSIVPPPSAPPKFD